jgi:hypothetical protein
MYMKEREKRKKKGGTGEAGRVARDRPIHPELILLFTICGMTGVQGSMEYRCIREYMCLPKMCWLHVYVLDLIYLTPTRLQLGHCIRTTEVL